MDRRFYLDLAAAGLRMPIGTHLVLHEYDDPGRIVLDGPRLGAIIRETARRYGSPLAVPLMDLTLEKSALLQACGVAPEAVESHHFTTPPSAPVEIALTPHMTAACQAIADVAAHDGFLPIGMSIGPFSLMTKLVSDPIAPVFLAGEGLTAADDPEVALVEASLAAAETVIHRYVQAQIEAGARAIIVCEPAANQVYFSPNQLARGHEVFDSFVMEPMRRLVSRLRRQDVDLVFHDCGELTEGMVRRFATLGAAMLSFGSSRLLWEDAALVPADTVLFGNLPTKRFYSPQLTVAEVERLALELITKMRATGHPFILGSECDVLSVPGSEDEITRKVNAFLAFGRAG